MGKAGRVACIFTPMALSIASLVCIILINLAGISKHSDTLNKLYFFQADFSNFSSSSSSSDELSTILTAAVEGGEVADFYQVHLWNYCQGNDTTATSSSNSSKSVTSCSKRKINFWFNPLEVWNIEEVINSTVSSYSSEIASAISSTNVTALEDELLDSSARKALKTYKTVSKWMFFAYFAGLWFLLATVIFGILAVFTRWFAFITSIFSLISTVLIFGASMTATIMFPILVKALKEAIDGFNISFKTSTHTLGVTWLATAFTLFATLFWVFSTCCCSGASNPHHRSNRDAPASEFGMGGAGAAAGKKGFFGRNKDAEAGQDMSMSGGLMRGRSTKVDKTGGNYERVASPYAAGGHDSDNVPLTHVAAPPYGHHGEASSYYQQQHASPYEPYRHN